MSHDVDLIVTRGELADLETMVDDLSESRHLAGTKWRATWRSIHLDLYAPYQSRLGANLQLRVEALTRYVDTVNDCRRPSDVRPTSPPRSPPCWTDPTASRAAKTARSCSTFWLDQTPRRGPVIKAASARTPEQRSAPSSTGRLHSPGRGSEPQPAGPPGKLLAKWLGNGRWRWAHCR